MRTSNSARPPFVGWAWTLLLGTLMAVILSACGGASYAKSAHEPPMAPGGYPGEAMATSTEAADDGDYDYEMEELAAAEYRPEMERGAPMPAPEPAPAMKMAQVSQPPKDKPSAATPPPPSDTKPTKPEIASDAMPIQQVLIYTAQLRMAVFEVDKALNDVEALARSLGGFLSHRTDTEITIRVPAAQFDDALKGISKKGDVLTRNVQVEDVTEEFLDVTLRLKNARQVRDRIAQLLVNAKNVEESLEVERELNRLSGEIERLEGRLKYLQNRARYSTITVTFQPEQVDEVPNSAFQLPFPWLRELGLGRLMNLR
jgi:Domain of unknown function (DUF4349)